jgi:hypothetical protein
VTHSRKAFVVALASVALVVALAVAAVGSAGAADVLVGRYNGHTSQGKSVEFRIERQGDALVIASFSGSLDTCGGGQGATFGARENTVIPSDGRVEFKALGGSVTVSIVIAGTGSVGKIDYALAGCKGNARFSAELQPPDPIVQAGLYLGQSTPKEPVEIEVQQKRGYFELTKFVGVASNCDRGLMEIDASPAAIIEGDGRVDFKALGGRVTVDIKFHHKSHAEGHIEYTHGSCARTDGFGARLKPAD